jgi:hypothetical protein
MLDPTGDPPSVLKTPAKTPAGRPDEARLRRETVLRMDAEGALAGTVTVRFGGQEGLRLRLDHLRVDADTVKKDLEGELIGLLPEGSKVTLRNVDNLRAAAEDVVAVFDVSLPPSTTKAGDRTLLPVAPLLAVKRDFLRHAQRKHPLSFPYPYQVSDEIVIGLPEGLRIDAAPAPRHDESDDWFAYSLSCAAESGTTLRVRRELTLKRCDFPAAMYGSVRAFFDRVRAADEERVMLVGTEK